LELRSENFHEYSRSLDYSQVDMHGVAHEAVFIYCECAATKQIGLPGGEKRADGFFIDDL
jgi:hypothetical protein